MNNHIHLLIEVNTSSPSRIMQSILTGYSRYFNIVNKRRGHVFQGRYKGIICEKENYLMELIRYIHLNPIRAKIVENLKEYKWSGNNEYSGRKKLELIDKGVISELFGNGVKGFDKYRKFLEDGINIEYQEEFHPGERNPFVGCEEFINKVTNREEKEIVLPKKKLEELLGIECKKNRVKEEAVRSKTRIREICKTRVNFIMEAVREYGYKQSEVAKYLRCNESYVSKIVRLGESKVSQV
jgi:hypothetical protein